MTTLVYLRRGAYRARQILKTSQDSSKIFQLSTRLKSSFVPKRVLILTKVSRYQIEKHQNSDLQEYQLKDKLLEKGTNYDAILAGHNRNKAIESKTVETLKNLSIAYRVRDRHNIDIDSIIWADLIVPIGGDGTFLMASNLINDNIKPILGINSDPEFSEGFLMLPTKYTNNIPEIFERLRAGQFEYFMRSRIRATLFGDNIWDMPFHMHNNSSSSTDDNIYVIHYLSTKPKGKLPKQRRLPWLALNEVFIGESLSAKISTLHINTGDMKEPFQKVKSSGLCVSTGTGSSSWYRAINALNPQVIEDVLTMSGVKNIPTCEDMKKICYDFNSKLQYPADKLILSYAIRDMIHKHTWPMPKSIRSRGFCDKLTVRSQCYDGGLVIDGGIAVNFNVGTTAVLETHEEDTLRNIVLPD